MPIYDYLCPKCEWAAEKFGSNGEPASIVCEECGHEAKKIIVLGHGGIQDNNPPWLNSDVREALQDSDAIAKGQTKPIETRSELKAHMDANNIVERG